MCTAAEQREEEAPVVGGSSSREPLKTAGATLLKEQRIERYHESMDTTQRQLELARVVSLLKVLATGALISVAHAMHNFSRFWMHNRTPARPRDPLRAAAAKKLNEDREPVKVAERLYVGSIGGATRFRGRPRARSARRWTPAWVVAHATRVNEPD